MTGIFFRGKIAKSNTAISKNFIQRVPTDLITLNVIADAILLERSNILVGKHFE